MLTFKDIKEYDLQNIDLKKTLENLTHRQDYLINIALVILAVFLVIKITTDQKGKATRLQQQVSVLEKKIGAISEYEDAENRLDTYIASLPQGMVETNTIIERLNNLAIVRNIQILSYDPLERQATDIHVKTNLKLSLLAQNYENLGLFIQDLEDASNNFRIEEWSANTEESGETISVHMVISSLYFKK